MEKAYIDLIIQYIRVIDMMTHNKYYEAFQEHAAMFKLCLSILEDEMSPHWFPREIIHRVITDIRLISLWVCD